MSKSTKKNKMRFSIPVNLNAYAWIKLPDYEVEFKVKRLKPSIIAKIQDEARVPVVDDEGNRVYKHVEDKDGNVIPGKLGAPVYRYSSYHDYKATVNALLDCIVDFRGDLKDTDGNPLEFSRENLSMFLEKYGNDKSSSFLEFGPKKTKIEKSINLYLLNEAMDPRNFKKGDLKN